MGDESQPPGSDRYELPGGYPARDQVAGLYDELDYQRAVQVYLWSLPAVSVWVAFEALRDTFGASLTMVPVYEHFLDAKTVVATGNGQSIYSIGMLDLGGEPVVLDSPPGVLGFATDLWQYPLADIGMLGPDKGQGGKFLLVPPGFGGQVPDGYFVIKSSTRVVNVGIRGFVRDGRPDSAVADIKKMRVYPLSQAGDPPPMRFTDASGVPVTLLPVGASLRGVDYFGALARMIAHEPGREQDWYMLGLAAALGISRDRPFEPGKRLTAILAQAARAGSAMAATVSFASRSPQRHTWPGTQWEEIIQSSHATLETEDYAEADAKTTLYYQAMGGSPSALLSIVGAGSKYSAAFRDAHGDWLDGSRSYQLTVPPSVPVKDFWSVTVYNARTRSMIDNEQGISGRDSYQNTLHANPDGSVDLYFGPAPPEGHRDNWVQTLPGTGFFVYFRWYGPLQAYFDKTWQLPDLEQIT